MIASRAAKPPFPSQLSSRTVLAFKGKLRRSFRRALDRCGPFRNASPRQGKGGHCKGQPACSDVCLPRVGPGQKPFTS